MSFYSVITSINPPNKCTDSVANADFIDKLIVVADKKSPKDYPQSNCVYFDLISQKSSKFSLESSIPFNHYSRKNLGYLLAFQMGAKYIYDTDDDNFLKNNNFLESNLFETNEFIEANSDNLFCNIYRFFTDQFIWPRGLPLDEIKSEPKFKKLDMKNNCDVIQFLADGNTDVDSIYRLIFDKHISFRQGLSFCLDKSIFSPTNSQSTIFTKKVFPLLYLPITVSFRFTDILRGIVLKNILDLHNLKLGFKSPLAFQDRNAHDYMNDFESEVSMFLNIKKANFVLSNLKSRGSITQDLLNAYKTLNEIGIVGKNELISCENWIKDLKKIDS